MTPKLIVEQKMTAFANKYVIYATEAEGQKGQLLALAQQKRIALKEKVTFYADENKTQEVFSFRAEKVMDIHGRYFVEDASGSAIGLFRKDFTQSLINSTWHILDADDTPLFIIKESSQALAVLRRFAGFIPIVGEFIDILMAFLRYHFAFIDAKTGEIVGMYRKTTLLRDHYLLSMEDEAYDTLDWRVFAAMAVALDALQSR